MQSTEKRIGIHGSLVDESRYTHGIMVTGAPVSVVMINETYYAVLSYVWNKKNQFWQQVITVRQHTTIICNNSSVPNHRK